MGILFGAFGGWFLSAGIGNWVERATGFDVTMEDRRLIMLGGALIGAAIGWN